MMGDKSDDTHRGSLLALRLAYYGQIVVALLDHGLAQPRIVLAVAGLVLIIGGLALRIAAGKALGKWWSLRAEIKEGQPLVQGGPYRFLRHPSYLGMLLVCLGIPIAFQSIWAAVVMALGVWPAVVHRMRIEDLLLERHFGDEYRAYTRRTASLIPGLF